MKVRKPQLVKKTGMKHEGQEDPAAELYWLRHQKDKKDLIRIVRTPDGDIVLDRTGKRRAAVPMSVMIPAASKSLCFKELGTGF